MCCIEGGDAAAAGGAEKTEEKKEDESKYTVIGSNAPKQKKGLSMYSKCGVAWHVAILHSLTNSCVA